MSSTNPETVPTVPLPPSMQPPAQSDSDTDEDSLSEIQLYQRRKRMQKNIKEYIQKYDVEDSPLFASNQDEVMDSTVVQAIQAMTYEDPPNEVAEGFKEQGSEALKEKNYRNALISYTQAIDACLEAKQHMALLNEKAGPDNIDMMHDLDPNLSGDDLQKALTQRRNAFNLLWEQMQKDPNMKQKIDSVEMQCFNNRAQVQLTLKNFRKCIEDCREVRRTVKSAYELRRYKLCKRYCTKATTIINKQGTTQDRKTLPLFEKHIKLSDQQIQKQIIKKREQVMKDRDNRVVEIIQESGIKLGKDEIQTNQLPPGAKPKKSDRVVLDENGKMVFQVLFVYDEFNQSDFIQAFHEEDRLVEHLGAMFPPHGPPFPFGNEKDQERYVLDNIEVLYFDQTRMGSYNDVYVRVKLNDSLGDVLRQGNYRLPNNLLPVFHVVHKDARLLKEWKVVNGNE
eukprot:CAMPEP_0117456016 /NCGR_PEP_ID=MMETSP0759-20121206/11659_1 /TAXON_ID=63605 /ORGANISM="Percolomonas cosmopolitus, Strain WS" /LENGTH=451 /DNA_ID=CAMNT_0005249341 /DNA_START=1 /DNA_END=1356 /DNA_ORIENTATION=+